MEARKRLEKALELASELHTHLTALPPEIRQSAAVHNASLGLIDSSDRIVRQISNMALVVGVPPARVGELRAVVNNTRHPRRQERPQLTDPNRVPLAQWRTR